MARCIAAKADGTQCVRDVSVRSEGTPAEGLCGRHGNLLVTGDAPVVRAATGEKIPSPQ